MKLNFPLLLVMATAICGLVWLIDALFFARNRRRRHLEQMALAGRDVNKGTEIHQPWLVEYARSFFPVLLIVLVLRSFIFEPFRIPSGSMIPTLLIGDFILVNKFSYGVRLPVIHTKIIDSGSPNRGDVAVFRFPDNPAQDYIKRVVGLPGDKISYRNKTLFVNGERAIISNGEPFIDPATDEEVRGQLRGIENLTGVEHSILINTLRPPRVDSDWEVPQGHYFMVGDNRDNSNDSRFWGTVPEENLVGRAFFIWMNWHGGSMVWRRIGDKII